MDHSALAREMRGLREQVAGITDTALAAADGLLIAADTADTIDPEGLAALAAAGLGLARRTAEATARGALHRTVAYGSHGCAAFYAVGENALMVVLGDEGMDVERLHTASQPALRRIDLILTGRTDRADRIGWSETTVKTAEGV
ncbi:roadblock/LC7 domain-containing protein [Streptomyces asoensis]|uniref:Dynein regulation protein LC7 n=1 Tax=Streptomyces asoensis TaxID=249586 RepID=A0ABQ3SC91_9ACTN|nr:MULTISPECIES: roadblock/LC7 domain-containing protein [Streptomyces]MBK3627982.1 roadblock/LC7 domain-containing protein [Streptomyces sp. MBT49]GGQ58218.1 dynein regulation protein LC7 [Streptomyces asoensis]GHI65662.1 dynein regulation protein LC7 [Streptomyces asoensis]